eukprot:gene13660-18429_t
MPGPMMLIVDSPHSYFSYGDGNFYSTIHIPGAVAYSVRFDNRSSVNPIDKYYSSSNVVYDYLNIFQDSTYNSYWGSPFYSGLAGSDAWSPEHNLTIYASSFVLRFYANTQISPPPWGFKMYITPLTTMPGPMMLIVDSPHSYFSFGNGNFYSTISIPGAVAYSVRFDNRSSVNPIYRY